MAGAGKRRRKGKRKREPSADTLRVQRRWKGRKVEMKLELDVPMIRWIHTIVCVPEILPTQMLGGRGEFAHYKGKDVASTKQHVSLQKWVKARLCDDTEKQNFVPGTYSLNQSLVDRLKEIHEHYKQLGMLATFAEAFVKVEAVLKGEKYIEDDSWEDPADEEDEGEGEGEGEGDGEGEGENEDEDEDEGQGGNDG